MDLTIGKRFKRAWNVFTNRDPTQNFVPSGYGYSSRPDRPRLSRGNERSIVTSIFNRIALDVAAIDIKHCKLDKNHRYLEDVDSGLDNCLNLEANIDQTGRAFIQDVVMSMLDEGCVAIVPVDTDVEGDKYDILTLRTGKVLEWYPDHVKVRLYNDRKGEKTDILLPKKEVAIIENPLYAVVNEPNSTMQRLIRKLRLLDITDDRTASGKLDMIVQLPYPVKTESRMKQAEARMRELETQLSSGKYGIAYIDAAEKVIQLNRSVENNLMSQIEYLTNTVYGQLGITQTVMDGSADEKTMLNYNNRTIEPIISAIIDEMKRKFLTETARAKGESIEYFKDPFKLVPVNDIAEIADKFTRNEIFTSNEIRQIVGMKPSSDPKADELVNSNISQPNQNDQSQSNYNQDQVSYDSYKESMNDLDEFDNQLDEIEKMIDKDRGPKLAHYASPYYDPQKAHEYYMKNRELKGRSSTAKLNEEGKMTAKYIKEQLSAERKQKDEEHSIKTNNEIETLRNQKTSTVEAQKVELQKKIDALMTKLKKMPEKTDSDMDSFEKEIKSLREDNEKLRVKLESDFQESSASLRSEHKQESARLKEEYDQKYEDELAKIRSDRQFQK